MGNEFLLPETKTPKDVTRRYGVFDLETLAPENMLVWAVGCKDGDGYKRFDVLSANGLESVPMPPEAPGGPLDQFLRYVFDSEDSRSFYAHNGGNFDFQYVVRWMLEHSEAYQLRTQLIPLSSSIMCMSARRGRYLEWRFLDSMRILPMSLDKVAATFGMEGKIGDKRDDEFYATLHRNPQRYIYLSQDCSILYKAIGKYSYLIKEIGAPVGISAASTAMGVFRRVFQAGPIRINRHFPGCNLPEGPAPSCAGCLHEFVRGGYYGGRSEVFFVEPFTSEVDVFYGDINSMYPHAMLSPMPCGEMHAERRGLSDVGFVDATVSIPRDVAVPPLPYRFEGKLLFPTGEFRGTWDVDELALVLECGGSVEQIHSEIWFEASTILANYVRALYTFRDKSAPGYTEGRAALAKILLNSLYGKFGSNPDRESLWINPDEDEISDHDLRDMSDVYKSLFLEKVFVYPDYTIPQIAAHITALARANLWRYLRAVKGRLYYCDTDSIISEHHFPWSNELGGMKLEKTARSGYFAAPKLYRFGDTNSDEMLKAKGFGGFGAKMDGAKWRDVVSGGIFSTGRMQKLKGWSKEGGSPHVFQLDKRRRAVYDKRYVFPDGTTRPWHIEGGKLT